MKMQNANDVYRLYDLFISECLLKNNSILSSNVDICNKANIEEVKKRFVEDAIEGNDKSYWEKIAKQFKGASAEVKLCFAHFNWLWYFAASDITIATKKDTPSRILDIDEETKSFKTSLTKDYVPKEGVASAGQYHKTNKPHEIDFLIILCLDIKLKIEEGILKNSDDIKKFIIEICLDLMYTDKFEKSDYVKVTKGQAIAMYSLLLHLSNPDFYEPIVSDRDKNSIITAFYHLVKEENETVFKNNFLKPFDYELNREDKIQVIRKVLSIFLNNNDFNFYSNNIKTIWNYGGTNKEFSSLQALIFKRSLILYGPPGTGKTYEAQQIASALISQFYINVPVRISSLLSDSKAIVDKRIHEFQFNPNTSYEEFIAGYQIVSGQTKAKKGQLLEIIDKATSENEYIDEDKKVKMPHVVILDEINRVDLSRVFGEVLSLLEYRNKTIPTAISGLTISIPDNLYFIGTMNEIDFSLERLDFALRRRFVWMPVLFDKDVLSAILETRFKKLEISYNPDDLQDFVNKCGAINDYITNTRKEDLGEKFQIGHAFFTDIVDILYQQKTLAENNIGIKKKKTLNVLWEISIGPLLDAYLGNIDGDLKSTYLNEAKALFI